MIHKLRRKFILINMSLVTLVLLIVFGALCLSAYRSEKQINLSALETTLGRFEMAPSRFPAEKPGPEASPTEKPEASPGEDPASFSQRDFRILDFSPQERMDKLKPCILILLNKEGELTAVLNEENAFLEEEEILQAISAIREAHDFSSSDREPDRPFSFGLLSSMGLRCAVRTAGEQVLVALVDRSNELVALRNLALTSLGVGAVSLAAFFLISLFLSSLALRPVEQAWQQQRQFIADASHELKTPLTVILANLGILQAHPEASVASQEPWISNTRTEAQRMKKLVDDLLYLARSDAGFPDRAPCDINVSDSVLNALLPFESVAFERGLTLESRITPDLHLCADAGQIKQLTAILLDNACKYSSDGARITVTLLKEQNRLVLRVSNQGPVIPRADQKRLFERFYRSDESRSRSGGGYGLGLAIAKSIVDFHKGNIFVEKSEAKETVFCVQLPCT